MKKLDTLACQRCEKIGKYLNKYFSRAFLIYFLLHILRTASAVDDPEALETIFYCPPVLDKLVSCNLKN